MLVRVGDGPLLDRSSVPDRPPWFRDPSGVFNPGAALHGESTVLLLRVQTRGRRTWLLPAAGDGERFAFAEKPAEFIGLPAELGPVHHNYDPRLTWIDGVLHVVTALDTDRGCRLAVWRAVGERDDLAGLDRLAFAGLSAHEDTRNGVLFPARFGGRYFMLERPNRGASTGDPASGDRIVLSATEDFTRWEDLGTVMVGRPRLWDELIGAGPPPVLTDAGWLLVYHGVATHFASVNVYQTGIAVLDRDDPKRVLARSPDNVLEPRRAWELAGQVPNVVFPSGLTVSATDSAGIAPRDARLHVYYGAADTVVGLAAGSVGGLINACEPC